MVKSKKCIYGEWKKTVFKWNKRHTSGEIEHSAAKQCKKDVPVQKCKKTWRIDGWGLNPTSVPNLQKKYQFGEYLGVVWSFVIANLFTFLTFLCRSCLVLFPGLFDLVSSGILQLLFLWSWYTLLCGGIAYWTSLKKSPIYSTTLLLRMLLLISLHVHRAESLESQIPGSANECIAIIQDLHPFFNQIFACVLHASFLSSSMMPRCLKFFVTIILTPWYYSLTILLIFLSCKEYKLFSQGSQTALWIYTRFLFFWDHLVTGPWQFRCLPSTTTTITRSFSYLCVGWISLTFVFCLV